MDKTFRLIEIDFTNHTGIGLSRNPGAKVCAEFHQLTSEQLGIIEATQNAGIGTPDGVVLPGHWPQPLSVLGIRPAAIFFHK